MYHEFHTRRIGIAIYRPTDELESVAESFGELVLTNLREGADLDTIEAWACHAFHYARMAQMDAEVRAGGWAAVRQLFGQKQEADDNELGMHLLARKDRRNAQY